MHASALCAIAALIKRASAWLESESMAMSACDCLESWCSLYCDYNSWFGAAAAALADDAAWSMDAV